MNKKVLATLEFDKIIQQLAHHASSEVGRSFAEDLKPSLRAEEVQVWLDETEEAVAVLRIKGNVPLDGIYDIRPHAKRAQIGGVLSGIELVRIASTIYASRMIRQFIEDVRLEGQVTLRILPEKTAVIPVLTDLEHKIKRTVDENGRVLDSASDELRHIRHGIRSAESRIRSKLESLTRGQSAQKMLSDAIVTIRNERYVIPVKQEYRSHYGGIVHDQSSSGQTLFVEPASVVNLNNELRELKVKEQYEVEKILGELTMETAEHAPSLFTMTKMLSEIDFIFTKGKFAHSMKATKPFINENGYIRYIQARHPLLPADEAVPSDIEIGQDYTAIVITGPNTGGKTVTLKTTGLSVLMAQSGLFIPAEYGSETAIFQSVFADIGDEQSIEQNLSTFSSHMVNISGILKEVDDQSLVLFDELGSGTDPQEGSALAISILDEVIARGARIIATTHYPELKAYGYNREQVINASVEFDVETLSPTYRLLIGIPGRSNAFEISKRIGLDPEIIERARSLIGADSHEVDNMIAALDTSRRQAEKDAKDAHDYLRETEKLHRDLQKEVIAYHEQKEKMEEKARVEAAAIIEKAKAEAEEVMRDLRAIRLAGGANVKEHELIEARKRLEGAIPEQKQKKPAIEPAKRSWKPGDEVKVISFGQKGSIIEKATGDEWVVQMGIIKMKVEESDMQFIKSEKKKEPKPIATIRGKGHHVSSELDLRGERYEEALNRVEKYLDDALLAGYHQVSIIHGKGTGALMKGVRGYLTKHRMVSSIRFGGSGEGGLGVTIAELK
ncbi:endonuclease MutS2 [Domibacillus mangrovi]|uniref:Endonuclease MutS2 n=1 Tax=Domibacillus mangrovi TaxID=1714354 RepID=A0A1Q5P827_9BACI|nr:endonuclease MutS2 [Domibacillus mangrovi]OKL38291.1 endonuclease MutS2 [Domibacillus mangrovi]